MKPVAWTLIAFMIPIAIIGDYFDDGCVLDIFSMGASICGAAATEQALVTGIFAVIAVALILFFGLIRKHKKEHKVA